MMKWEDYVEARWNAHKQLMWLIDTGGIRVDSDNFYPDNIEEFRESWGETIDPKSRKAYFKRDDLFIKEEQDDGIDFIYYYLSSADNKPKPVTVKLFTDMVVDQFFVEKESLQEDERVYLRNIECIIFSDDSPHNSLIAELSRLNNLRGINVRFFHLKELQFNPVLHADQVRRENMRVLLEGEIQEFIQSQIGLKLERGPIGGNYHELKAQFMEEGRDEELELLEIKTRNLVLSYLPELNSSDPFAKWYNLRPGDVIEINRDGEVPSLEMVVYSDPSGK